MNYRYAIYLGLAAILFVLLAGAPVACAAAERPVEPAPRAARAPVPAVELPLAGSESPDDGIAPPPSGGGR